ncbi:MAG: hypothetical protein C5B60_01860 [Chloroflexi bacterium]|nr:MAG: hypothetical protein C5B60_01860 [Chloroflexota bacterium]
MWRGKRWRASWEACETALASRETERSRNQTQCIPLWDTLVSFGERETVNDRSKDAARPSQAPPAALLSSLLSLLHARQTAFQADLAELVGLDSGTYDLASGRTVNVGTIQAGTRPNVVPDLATALVDLRANTRSDMDLLLQECQSALASSALPGTTYTWTPLQFRPPWEPNERTRWLVELAGQVALGLGFPISAAATGGTSDGNFTAAMGIATLDGLGPVGGLDHSPQEYVDIDSIVPRTALLAGLINSICSD